MTYKIKSKKPIFIQEPYGLPQELQEKDKFAVENKSYNGWTNFNTWQIALNIDNDEATYNMSREAIKEGQIKDGESYKEWFKENFESKEEGFYKIYDGWSNAELDDVDWDEIYKNHSEE